MYFLQPFKKTITPEKLKLIIFELENLNLIEIIDSSGNNIIYRFNNNFMRETIYERLALNKEDLYINLTFSIFRNIILIILTKTIL